MKKFLITGLTTVLFFIAGSGMAAKDQLTPSSQSNDFLAETRIVGGEQANQQNWPWMTAYVFTLTELVTSLSVNQVTYSTSAFTSGAGGQASGEMISCGIGDTICADATGKVCLLERGDVNFSEKADNCEAGGGIGAIIYNNEALGNISGTLGENYTGTIPVVAVTQEDGLTLLEQLGSVATLAVSETSELQQDASCGASFLGDKWVLTAAHCVDSPNASLFKMNVGEYNLSDGADKAIDIANIYIHPLYDADAINNDIALVELVSSPVNPPAAIQIADAALTEQYAIENSLATVAGWGGRVGYEPDEGPTSDFPDILHQVSLQLLTNQQCIDSFNKNPQTFVDETIVTSNMICAAIPGGNKGSCQGDSGGPLVINTGSGPQQVGIVSWGIGCAADLNPGVYTRVAVYKDWISAITDGVAIIQRHDFGIGLGGQAQTTEIMLTNNSEVNVGLSFELSGSTDFTLDATNCVTLDAASSCQLIVNYLPTLAGQVSAELTITADSDQVQTSSAVVSGTTLTSADELSAIVGSVSDAVTLFTGGSSDTSGWAANSVEGLDSGTTGDLQSSVLVAQIEGEGVLTFDWSVSSEENTDDPEEPFDTLSLYLNGVLLDFISGEVAFAQYSIDLAAGSNRVNWTYSKDFDTADGQDKGFIRNVVFTPVIVPPAPTPDPMPTPTPAPAPAPTPIMPVETDASGGGGSLGWIMLCLLGLGSRLKTKKQS